MSTFLRQYFLAPVTALVALAAGATHAALTDLADNPLSSASSTQVKPNILFVLDDSGSMDWRYMPDAVGNSSNLSKVGFRNAQCNLVYYNPAINYETPRTSTGDYVNAASPTGFTTAYDEGFHDYDGNGTDTTDLSSGFRAFSSDSTQPAYYWKYLGGTTLTPLTGDCQKSLASYSDASTMEICTDGTLRTTTCASAGKTALWRKIIVSATSGPPGNPDERQNFANWYSYYSTRVKMMKSATGRAFVGLSDSFRVGFITINPGSPVSSTKFLAIDDFNSTQKSAWYTKLYSQIPNSSTPLRTALSRAGRYFAHQTDGINNGMSDDPVQYSCQQNFTILTTDGYWNGTGGLMMNGSTAMDNEDGNLAELDAYNPPASKFAVSPRPIYDGMASLYVWNTLTRQTQQVSCSLGTITQTKIVQWQSRPVIRQKRITQIQSMDGQLQSRTSHNGGGSWSGWHNVTTCTPDSIGQDQTQCQTIWGTWYNSSSCTPNSGEGTQRQCQTTDTGWVNVASCNASSGGGQTVTCQILPQAGWSNTTGACTENATTQCQKIDVTGWTTVPSCTTGSVNANGQQVVCQTVTGATGYKQQYRYLRASKKYPGPNQSGTQVGGTTNTYSSWVNYPGPTGTCASTQPALPAGGDITGADPTDYSSLLPASCLSGTQQWPCETAGGSTGGSSNSLADVAQYYYKNDLRTTTLSNCAGALGGDVDVCANNVPTTGTGPEDDKASWQHMTTFTMGLGLSGTLPYRQDYKTATTGSFQDLRTGVINWPTPAADSATALDDLWHAAVDGRGQYFSAGNPTSVIDGLNTALAGVSARLGAAAAAATSNLEPVAGDNFAYTAKYVTQKWTGELEAHQIDLETGAVNADVVWSAQAKLDALGKNACDSRVIKLFRVGATDNLVNFTWNTYACDASGNPTGSAQTALNTTEQGYFNAGKVALLSQYPDMTDGSMATVDQRTPAAGANLVNFVRGQRGFEGFVTNDATKLYRTRDSILGDIINAQPVYVKAPFAEYDDGGYVAFKTAQASRTPMVYAAANDGMLHAFYAGTSITDPIGGTEAWAFIPDLVLPNLYIRASMNYANQHTYTVDGTPTVGDVYDIAHTAWKTILVAGLNKGGKGYYALDVTDPAAPKALWEFANSATCYDPANASPQYTDCHIGYTFNNPIISKLRDGRWVVFVTSGYNNDDGNGYLYVLEAMTGKIIYRIATGAGSAATPSGLNHISAWVEDPLHNNQTERVYGVDLLGNVWRFDVNDLLAPAGIEATRLATLVDSSGDPQPITTRPELSKVNDQPYVHVGTGRYLGTTDSADTQTQTVWTLHDNLTTTPLTDLRATLRQMTITDQGSGTSAFRTIGCTAQCGSTEGWFADLPDSGERVNIDMKLQLGTLVVASNVPQNNACNIGGYSWLNYFDNATGNAIATSPNEAVGTKLVGAGGSESLAVGVNIVRLPGGKTVVIATTSAAQQVTVNAPFVTPPPTGKRVSWREIVQ